eukprot:1154880-Pelagomonas_calceolata.AAC.5
MKFHSLWKASFKASKQSFRGCPTAGEHEIVVHLHEHISYKCERETVIHLHEHAQTCYVVTSQTKKYDLGYDHGDRCSQSTLEGRTNN